MLKRSLSKKRAREDTALTDLLKWCQDCGAVLDGVRLSDQGERGFFATKDLSVGHVALTIPASLVLTVDVALSSEVGVAIAAEPTLRVMASLADEARRYQAASGAEDEAVITQRSVLCAYLIHQRHVAKSGGWTAYARSLPAAFSTPFTWPAHDWTHTALHDETARLRSHTSGQFERLFPRMSERLPALFPAAVFTSQAWEWANDVYATRCFPKDAFRGLVGAVPSAARSAEEDEDGILVPLVDMLNHDHATCHVGWASSGHNAGSAVAAAKRGKAKSTSAPGRGQGQASQGGVGRMVVFAPVAAHEQVLYSYGPKPNIDLVYYGFAQWDNPWETLVSLGLGQRWNPPHSGSGLRETS